MLANAHGSGVLEDPELAGYWPDALAALTGLAADARRLDGRRAVLATVPAFRDGRTDAAPVVVRLHAVGGPDGVVVMAGGNGRVLAAGDDPRRPTARLAKDVWVLGAERAPVVITAPPLPQVDLASSVPTRAADALFWVGRAAERAEALARTARVVAARRQQDPGARLARRGPMGAPDGRACCAGAADGARDGGVAGGRPIGDDSTRARRAGREVAERLAALVAGAATVGEYLSAAAGRVLESLAEHA